MWFGYYVQMVAAFLLLALSHYFAASFLPIADCDETFNFVEPIHHLLFGSGLQTWENCPQFALRSYLFAWVYAWPAMFIRGASGLSSVDVYYYLRIFNGRVACLCELFFVYSVWSAFSGKTAMVALMLLLLNYPIPHAAVSVLPTSFAMCCYFAALGCWLRTRSHTTWSLKRLASSDSQKRNDAVGSLGLQQQRQQRQQQSRGSCLFFVWATVFLVVFACVAGWPFAGLVAVPCGLDLLLRFPLASTVSLVGSLVVVCGAAFALDTYYYCKPVLSAWNVVKYNVFGGADRGPELYGVEPWFYFFKNLLLNFHIVFLASLAAPLVVLATRRHRSSAVGAGLSRGRLLLYVSPYFLWLLFWTRIAHKEERFFAPAYPFLILSATVVVTRLFFPDDTATTTSVSSVPAATAGGPVTSGGATKAAATAVGRRRLGGKKKVILGALRPYLFAMGMLFLLAFGTVSFSRAMAIYHFYSGPERMLYDWQPLLQALAVLKARRQAPRSDGELFTVCVGQEWYRFPSSFFVDHRSMRYRFLKTESFDGMLPVPFVTPAGTVSSGGLLNPTPPPLATPSTASSTRGAIQIAPRETTGACVCGAPGVNDLNRAIPEQFVANVAEECDVVFDSQHPHERAAATEKGAPADRLRLADFPYSVLNREALQQALQAAHQPYHEVDDYYAILDVDHTSLWCRVLYYPLGLSQRCAAWRPLYLRGKTAPLSSA